MDEAMKAFLFTISGTLIGSMTTIIITFISKKSELKKQVNDMIIQSAIENWHGVIDIVKTNGSGKIPPLDAYLISSAALYRNIDFTKIKISKLKERLDDVNEINNYITEYYKAKDIKKS